MKDIMPRHREAALLAMQTGFAAPMKRHTALFYRRSSQTLVVTFDNMKSREAPKPTYPWGYDFLREQNYSHLGIMMRRRNDWFRHSDLTSFFDQLREEEFFKEFQNVVFYGSSMGGYGALAYASSAPGARVVTFSPQTSIDPIHVPFETRYRKAFARGDWSGPYLDGAIEAKTASQVIVFADPYEPLDNMHAIRLSSQCQVDWMKMPFSGHNTMRRLLMQGVLSEAVLGALEGSLTPKSFQLKMRRTRGVQTVARTSLNRALEKGHSRLVLSTLKQLNKSKPEWKFPKLKKEALQLYH
jgi:pimeloyl-ACP methyl ester carboxylesterase